MPLDLNRLDQKDARLIQAGLKQFGFYDGTMLGRPGSRTKAAYERYLQDGETPPAAEPPAGGELDLPASVTRELTFPGEVKDGTRGRKARQVQEWLMIHGFQTAIDEDFGAATKRAVENFQRSRGLSATGRVNKGTWEELVAPMKRAFAAAAPEATLAGTVLGIARQHLKEHPIELGGANSGPWVRAYMSGNQGSAWPWCAGFVTWVLKQASQIQGVSVPIAGSFSCDSLASQADSKGLFVSERSLDRRQHPWNEDALGKCSIFLVRRTPSDWTHTGFAFSYNSNNTFSTIEGNTNDEGSREGFEVCKRVRARGSKDFIRLN